MKRTFTATLAALLGYSIFGFSFLFSSLALGLASPSVLLAYRFLVAFLVLNIILFVTKKKLSLSGKPVLKLLFMGLLQPVIYFICEAYGISLTTASFSGVMIGLSPVAGVVIGAIFLKEKCTPLQLVCTFLSVAGVAMTTTGGFGSFSPLGFVLLLVSVVSAASFTAISRSLADSFSPFERTYVMFAMGSAVFLIMALFQNEPAELFRPLCEVKFIAALLFLAVLSSVCAFLLINFAVNHISASHTLILSNFSTVISVLAGIFILGDSFAPLQIAGIVVIIISVFGVSYNKKEEKK